MRRFFYGPGIDEPICMINVPDGHAIYYYHFDGLGSVVALSDADGTIVEKYKYDVFGEVTLFDINDAEISESGAGNPYYFTGRRYDDETGLYYYRARYYSPKIGRFLQTDPTGYIDGMNLYSYVENNPINWVDPAGLYSWEGKGYFTTVSKGLCKVLRPIPYCGTFGARALEMGWCNGMSLRCNTWCETSEEVPDNKRDQCRQKCTREHLACVGRSSQKKCKFKFKISG